MAARRGDVGDGERGRAQASPSSASDRGAATVAVIIGAGLLTIVFMALVNLVVYQYGQGTMRTAADQAARSGARASASEGACVQRANETLDVLLGGSLRDQIHDPQCQIAVIDGAEVMRATITADFESWGITGLGLTAVAPDLEIEVSATSARERSP